MTIAVIASHGKQYLISEGTIIELQKKITDKTLQFDQVLLLANDQGVKIGAPNVAVASAQGNLIGQRSEKTLIWQFKSKTRRRPKRGYKNPISKVKITKISV